jgi:hypothetical protein
MWSDFETIRNAIAYEDEPAQPAAITTRERSRLAMRRLYAKRRAAGLNAHGKPYAVAQRINRRFRP